MSHLQYRQKAINDACRKAFASNQRMLAQRDAAKQTQAAAAAAVFADAEAKPCFSRSWKGQAGDLLLWTVLCTGLAASAMYLQGFITDSPLMQPLRGKHEDRLADYSILMHEFATPLQVALQIAEVENYAGCASLHKQVNARLQNLSGSPRQNAMQSESIMRDYEAQKRSNGCDVIHKIMQGTMDALGQQNSTYVTYLTSKEGFPKAAALIVLHCLLHFCSTLGPVAFAIFSARLIVLHIAKAYMGLPVATYMHSKDMMQFVWGCLVDFEGKNPELALLIQVRASYTWLHDQVIQFLPYYAAYAGELLLVGGTIKLTGSWTWSILSGTWVVAWWMFRCGAHNWLCSMVNSRFFHREMVYIFLFLLRYCASLLFSWIPYRFSHLMGAGDGSSRRKGKKQNSLSQALRQIQLPWRSKQQQLIVVDLGEEKEEREDEDDGIGYGSCWDIVLQWYRHRNVVQATMQLIIHFAFCMYMHRAENVFFNSMFMDTERMLDMATSAK